jgi:hypothetical protein
MSTIIDDRVNHLTQNITVLLEDSDSTEHTKVLMFCKNIKGVEAAYFSDIAGNSRVLDGLFEKFNSPVPFSHSWQKNFAQLFTELLSDVKQEARISCNKIAKSVGIENVNSVKSKPSLVAAEDLIKLANLANWEETKQLDLVWAWLNSLYTGTAGNIIATLLAQVAAKSSRTELLSILKLISNQQPKKGK